jgi:glycine/D-amino acid oxidase-like deaminating enzyme
MRVVILGAGLAGRSAAHALLARGVRPTVLAPDRGESARGAGILSAQFRDADLRAAARRSAEIVARLVPVDRCGHAQMGLARSTVSRTSAS